MSTQEEKKMTDEELNAAAEETVKTTETPENTESAEQPAEQEEPLSELDQLKLQLAEAETKNAELQDKYLRQAAEFDNYRKRTIKEKAELIKSAAEKLMVAELPVLDDMDRALENMEKGMDADACIEGFKLIVHKFQNILTQNGLEKIETDNQEFDTDYHEAIALIPAPSEELKGKILDCVQPGYKLGDKVIRHAKVAVGQ
ncbi:MAG: nucleotide exchange factor GrpE [Bacteroidaceae bacterium]|nr:nucleotide exchange factor GrpE [Bacteroidaceae bacterium]MBO5134414.1 nucleotide exchange factor GrpE [Bacteroidaceae bacterium]MBR3985146.1 nucleotide exchange factor GrpE [Bacteroidaceae bacterium]